MGSGNLVPVPSFLKGDKGAGWKVKDSGGGLRPAFLNTQDRVMQVPLEGKCILCGEWHGRALRNHEQAHIRFTLDKKGRMPKLRWKRKAIREEYFNAVEDIRMDVCIRGVGVKQGPIQCVHNRPVIQHHVSQYDDKDRVLWMVASGLKDLKQSTEIIRAICEDNKEEDNRLAANTILDLASKVRTMVHDGTQTYLRRQSGEYVKFPSIKNTMQAAKWLQDVLENLNVDPQGEPGDPQQGQGDPNDDGYDVEKGQMPEAEAEADQQQKGMGDDEYEESVDDGSLEKDDPNPHLDDEFGGWGPMTIEDVPKPRSLPGRLRRKKKPTAEGYLPGDMTRWMTDQAIFSVDRKHAGGTILVDVSGSMHLETDTVYAWMEEFPGVKVATYNGDQEVGWLRIIADKGRVCDPHQVRPPGGYNTVDGPALAWLGQQGGGPRIWVSDGHVNGRGGFDTDALNFECDLIRRRFRIKQVDPNLVGKENVAEDVVKVLKRSPS